MSFAGRASLGDSCDVYRAASMTVGGGGSTLFRQELGLSSDSKILLIYDISTPVFSPTPLTPSTNAQQGDDDIQQNCLFVYLLLSPQRVNFPPVPSCIFYNHILLLCVAVLLNDQSLFDLHVYDPFLTLTWMKFVTPLVKRLMPTFRFITVYKTHFISCKVAQNKLKPK